MFNRAVFRNAMVGILLISGFSSFAQADALEDGRLVVVEAEQHTGYGVNDCVVDLVSDYLIDRVIPDDDTECA